MVVELLSAYLKFIYAPLLFVDMLWLIIPLFLYLLVTELYFDRYPREGIGFHKSLENTLFLIFIVPFLIKYVYSFFPMSDEKLYVAFAFGIFSVVIAILDFFHKLPVELIWKRSSKFMVVFVTYTAIVLIYSDMLESLALVHLIKVFLAIVLFFITVILIRWILTVMEPKSYEEIEHFLGDIEKDIKKFKDGMSQTAPKKNIKKSKQ
jgi:hypothetical protein